MHRAAGHLLVLVECVQTQLKLTPGGLRHRFEGYSHCQPPAGGCLLVAGLGPHLLVDVLQVYLTWRRCLGPIVEAPSVVCTSTNSGYRPNTGKYGKIEFLLADKVHM